MAEEAGSWSTISCSADVPEEYLRHRSCWLPPRSTRQWLLALIFRHIPLRRCSLSSRVRRRCELGGTRVSLDPHDISAIAVAPTSPSLILAATSGGIARSVDGGTNWTVSSGSPAGSALAIDSVHSSVAYTGNSLFGVFKTENSAASWHAATAGLNATFVTAVAVSLANPLVIYAGLQTSGVFRSTNGGVSWTLTTDGIIPDPSARAGISAIAVDPIDPDIAYVGTFPFAPDIRPHGDLYKTVDGGVTWSLITNGLSSNLGGITAIVIDPLTPTRLYCVSSGLVFRSAKRADCRGTSRSPPRTPRRRRSAYSLSTRSSQRSFTPAAAMTVVARCCSRVSMAESRGSLRVAVWPPSLLKPSRSNPFVHATVYAGAEGGGGVFKSVDGGSSWGASGDLA